MTAEERAPGFDFARQMRDRDFRVYLARAGYRSGMCVAPVGAHSSWVAARQLAPEDHGPVLLARQDPNAPYGWRLRYLSQLEFVDPEEATPGETA